jgi:LmbE family N-acetylglucosaminyl deacetylase
MIEEPDIISYQVSTPPGERVIVIAPHPDDETLGCGGTIRLLLEGGKRLKVVFLTSGDKADPSDPKSSRRGIITPSPPSYLQRRELKGALSLAGEKADHVTAYSLMREEEAGRALKVLGVDDYVFMRFPDRELHSADRDVLGRLSDIVREFIPDTIYAPSMIEVNPDHRAAAAMAMEMQRKNMEHPGREGLQPIRTVCYEIATPLRPNILVDITSVYDRKKRAVKKYRSQLRLKDYLLHITSLNTIRSLTVSGPRYVEAFWLIDRPLTDEEIIGWLGYRELRSER